MFYVNDDYYDADYLQACFENFQKNPVLSACAHQRLAVCLPDTALWIALCLFIRKNGGSVFPVHPATPIDAATRMAHRTACHKLFFHELDAPVTISQHGPDKTAVLVQMSSGTTGEPKAIERSWNSIDCEIESYVKTFTLAADMTPVVACPVTHSYGLICGVLVALMRGIEPVIITQINPKYLIKKLLGCERSLLYASPTLINTVVQLLPRDKKLHAVMTSGSVMPKAWFTVIKEKAGFVFQQYGCSEAGCVTISQSLHSPHQLGRPLPHVEITSGTIENPAEIIVKKDGLMIHTRDLGYFDAENNLYFLARIDDTINVAGLNIYPQEVEDVLLEFASITEAVVYKKEDAYAGERACLKFVATTHIDLAVLRAWCSANLAPHQIPVEFQQVEAIAKLPNGKINRKNLAKSSEIPLAIS